MVLNTIPILHECCGCVTDLKTAAAIIAVLGIVTSPAISWTVVRHTYVIRLSCIITGSVSRPDVVDVNLNNILSFGFGANAGFGPSCLSKNRTKAATEIQADEITLRARESGSKLVASVRYVGWAVLVLDILFLCSSINLLMRIYNGPVEMATRLFMGAGAICLALSFVYNMLYVAACMSLGGAFPVVEFIFAFVDLFLWIYFLIVVNSYRRITHGP